MEPRVRDTRILTGAEVKALAKAVSAMLGPGFAEIAARFELRAEDGIRFHAVAAKCTIARESRNLSVKQAAATLRVPQYRLKAIERSSTREVRGDILERYAALLELTSWLRRWATANRALSAGLGLSLAQRRSREPSNKPLQLAGAARNGRRSSNSRRSRGARS